jgi:hypothetical protein
MKTATLLIYQPHQTNHICVQVSYRRNYVADFLGHPSELQELTEKAIAYMVNQKFTRLKVNGKTYNFKDFIQGQK